MTIADVIRRHKTEAMMQRKLTSDGYEWIGLCLKPLLEDIRAIQYPHSYLYGDTEPLIGKRCVCFLTQGMEG